ncbi:MAG TPA: hypothetical protein VGC64_03740 [Pyrinomonadaceae bacterium]|jgi:hypothetical protein
MARKNMLVGDCVSLLAQGLALLERLDRNLYVRTKGLHCQSGVGSHFRHCLDFVKSFLDGLETGCVDYNRRERAESIELYPSVAINRIRETIAALEALTIHDGETPLRVSLEGNDDDASVAALCCASTVVRELQFLQSHLTHHYALVALMLRLQGFEPGAEFGVTPSTLRHWRKRAACAR